MFKRNTMEPTNMLLRIIITALAIGGASGLVAAVYRCILAYEPIMTWWWKFGNRYEGKWFFAPIWGCQKCIGGQMGLWFYMLICILPILGTHTGRLATFGGPVALCIQNGVLLFFGLLISICGAIYSADKICSTTIKN